MANYNIVANFGESFKPFTFLEMVAPFLLYKKDYQDTLEKLEKYSEKLGEILLPEDSIYQGLLLKYRDDLLTLKDSFYKLGLNYYTGAEANRMFRRAGVELTPIQKGIERYNSDIDRFGDIFKADNSAFLSKNLSIDDYIGSSAKKPIKAISGKLVVAETAAVTKAHLDLIKKDASFKDPRTGYIVQYFELNKLSLGDLSNMADNPAAYDISKESAEDIKGILTSLRDAYAKLLTSYGYDDMSEDAKKKFDYYKMIGAQSGFPGLQQTVSADDTWYKLKLIALSELALHLDELKFDWQKTHGDTSTDSTMKDLFNFKNDPVDGITISPKNPTGAAVLDAAGLLGDNDTLVKFTRGNWKKIADVLGIYATPTPMITAGSPVSNKPVKVEDGNLAGVKPPNNSNNSDSSTPRSYDLNL